MRVGTNGRGDGGAGVFTTTIRVSLHTTNMMCDTTNVYALGINSIRTRRDKNMTLDRSWSAEKTAAAAAAVTKWNRVNRVVNISPVNCAGGRAGALYDTGNVSLTRSELTLVPEPVAMPEPVYVHYPTCERHDAAASDNEKK